MAMVDTMARGLLMPSPRLRLMPGTVMVAFTAMASQLMADMAMVDTMARGLLMPSPRLRLRLMAGTAMVDTMARGLLMPSPRLRLMPGTDMVAFTDMASQPMADTAMVDTTARSKILSLTSPTA